MGYGLSAVMSTRPIFVVAGVGNASGTGGASAYVALSHAATMHDWFTLRCSPSDVSLPRLDIISR